MPGYETKPRKTKKNRFLLRHKEKLLMNQYWYSADTIEAMVADIEEFGTRCAFLSTPSLFFSLKNKDLQANSKILDFDEMWADKPGFVKYNFKEPENIPAELHHQFDFIIVDPPFITEEVWAKYLEACKLLLVEGYDEPCDGKSPLAATKSTSSSSDDADTGLNSPIEEKGADSGPKNDAQLDIEPISETETDQNDIGDGCGVSSHSSQAAGAQEPDFSAIDNPFASSSKVMNTPPASPSKSKASDQKQQNADDGTNQDEYHLCGGVGNDKPQRSKYYPTKMPKGKVMFTTIAEHEDFLHTEIGASARRFRPSIPNLMYQYRLYTNYPSPRLEELNPEIDSE